MGLLGASCLLLALVLGACCGSAEVAAVSRAAREVRAATDAGAREQSQAAYFLALASSELARADVQLRVGDAEGARSFAARARADAALARMLAIEAAARGAALRSEDDAEALSRALDEPRPR